MALEGKKSGLSKVQFIVEMFKSNEKNRKTDAELATIMRKEFPGTVEYPIKSLRSKLNRGGFGKVKFTSKSYEGGKKLRLVKKAA